MSSKNKAKQEFYNPPKNAEKVRGFLESALKEKQGIISRMEAKKRQAPEAVYQQINALEKTYAILARLDEGMPIGGEAEKLEYHQLMQQYAQNRVEYNHLELKRPGLKPEQTENAERQLDFARKELENHTVAVLSIMDKNKDLAAEKDQNDAEAVEQVVEEQNVKQGELPENVDITVSSTEDNRITTEEIDMLLDGGAEKDNEVSDQGNVVELEGLKEEINSEECKEIDEQEAFHMLEEGGTMRTVIDLPGEGECHVVEIAKDENEMYAAQVTKKQKPPKIKLKVRADSEGQYHVLAETIDIISADEQGLYKMINTMDEQDIHVYHDEQKLEEWYESMEKEMSNLGELEHQRA